jgi:hypothetical protein
MKKSVLFFVFLFLIALSSYGQKSPETDVSTAVDKFMKGIVDADKNLLESITADELVYGHSSGKVQNKTEFVGEVVSIKPIDYLKIDLTEQTVKVIGKTAVVRHILSADITNNGIAGHLKIGNMLIWQKQKGVWKLIARQAYKL